MNNFLRLNFFIVELLLLIISTFLKLVYSQMSHLSYKDKVNFYLIKFL